MQFRKTLLLSTLILGAWGVTLSAPVAQAKTAQVFSPAKVDWPQQISDIKPDPAVTYGRLKNGMRYAIMKNATPAGQVSVRLRFATGSLQENESQLGLAHFIEHMAFNGSESVKPEDFVKKLELFGLAFGPDTNAFTSFDQTAYLLDLPRNDDEIVQYALFLMRETAGKLSFLPEEIEKERGVVLSEERLRDSPGLRVAKAQLNTLMRNQLLPKRFPIGDTKILKTAPRQTFVDYYERYYRPERAILVVVGDIDPARIEASIKTRFSDWVGKGKAGTEPDLGTVDAAPFLAEFYHEPQAQSTITIATVRPYAQELDDFAQRKKDIIESLGFAVLNRRFADITRRANAPFIGAGAGNNDLFRSVRSASINTTFEAAKWKEALSASEQEARRARQFGFLPSELAREIADRRAGLEAAVKGASTRPTPALAGAIFGAYGNDAVFSSPQTDLEIFDRAVQGLDVAQVNAAFNAAFEGGRTRLFMSSSQDIEGGTAALTAAYEASAKVAVEKPKEQSLQAFNYDFGKAGSVASEKKIDDLGVTQLVFANGVKANIFPSTFEKDDVRIFVRFGSGTLAFPKDKPGMPLMLAPALIEGGLGKFSKADLERALTGRIYSAGIAAQEDAFVVNGRTNKADFDLQMQVLAAHFVDPGFRPEGVDRIRNFLDTIYKQFDSGALQKAQIERSRYLHNSDSRFGLPDLDTAKKLTVEDVKAVLSPALATAPIEITIVGDVSVDEAKAAIARTFGALAPRQASVPVSPEARIVSFPKAGSIGKFEHGGRADQNVAAIAWPTRDDSDIVESARLQILRAVLQDRATDYFREKIGATYSPQTFAEGSDAFPGYGNIGMAIETPPDQLDAFFKAAEEIVASLRDKPISAEDLNRAKRPVIERSLTARKTNAYWAGALSDLQTDLNQLSRIRRQIELLEAVSAADVQKLAQTYLKADQSVRMLVTPRAKP